MSLDVSRVVLRWFVETEVVFVVSGTIVEWLEETTSVELVVCKNPWNASDVVATGSNPVWGENETLFVMVKDSRVVFVVGEDIVDWVIVCGWIVSKDVMERIEESLINATLVDASFNGSEK